MKNDQPPTWKETVNLPNRPPIRHLIDKEVWQLARKLASAFEGEVPETRHAELIIEMYDELMKAQVSFGKLNAASYKGRE